VVVAGYEVIIGTSGLTTPGFTYPGRYDLICMPLAGIALMVALSRVRSLWVGFVPLLALSLALTVNAAQHTGYVLLNTGLVGLPLAQHLESAFPDIEGPVQNYAFGAGQQNQRRTVGRLRGTTAVAEPKDGTGLLSVGPGVTLGAGDYVATFNLLQRGARDAGQAVADVQLWGKPGVQLADRPVYPADLPSGQAKVVYVPFSTAGDVPIEARVQVYGRAHVEAGPIEVKLARLPASPLQDAHPDAALMLLWVFLTVLVGALLVGAMRRQPGDSAVL
jgi:hypothetical protein